MLCRIISIAFLTALLSFGCGDGDTSGGAGAGGSGGAGGEDCSIDTDRDGTPDCTDDDDDDDGIDDEREATLETDPLDRDSDRDGIEDGVEVDLVRTYSPDGLIALATTRTDPTIPTVLVEVDYVMGFRPNAAVFQIAASAFDHAGMEIYFMIDVEPPIPTTALPSGMSPWTNLQLEQLLVSYDDQTAEVHEAYVHVLVVPDDNSPTRRHGTSHHARPNNPSEGNHGSDPDPQYAGSFVFIDTIKSQYASYATEFSGAMISEDQLIARTLIHELGHLLGCTEEGSIGGYDQFNVMTQNGRLGNPSTSVTPWTNNIFGAGGVGHPTFSEASLEQMDLTRKLSVETGVSPLRQFFDMGTATSAIRANYRQITETTAYDEEKGYGWESPLPTVSSTSGSLASDERFVDYVAGDPNEEAPTRFRVSGLGTGPVDVFFRLGAQVTDAIDVRCEIRHPELGLAFEQGTIDASSMFVSTPANGRGASPVESTSALGYGTADLVVECLNDGTYADAPIEIINFEKREP